MTISTNDSNRKPEGFADGVQPNAGPVNKFDGVGAHPEVDNCTNYGDIKSGLRFQQPWQTGQGAPASSGFALGNIPD